MLAKSHRHILYALISFACPFVAFAVIWIYQYYSYDWYWELMAQPAPLDDADINAGSMMSIFLAVQIIIAVGIGSLIGLGFAGMSLKRNPRILSVGTAAMLFNLLPLVVVMILFFNRGT